MEVDERPTEEYSDIGGLDKQIQEVCAKPNCRPSLNTGQQLAGVFVIVARGGYCASHDPS
jgi:hypothetical protein